MTPRTLLHRLLTYRHDALQLSQKREAEAQQQIDVGLWECLKLRNEKLTLERQARGLEAQVVSLTGRCAVQAAEVEQLRLELWKRPHSNAQALAEAGYEARRKVRDELNSALAPSKAEPEAPSNQTLDRLQKGGSWT